MKHCDLRSLSLLWIGFLVGLIVTCTFVAMDWWKAILFLMCMFTCLALILVNLLIPREENSQNDKSKVEP